MPKKHRKSNKGKIIGGFLGAIVLIGIIGFTLVKFDFIDLDILDGIFNKGDDLSKEVYCKEVSEENVKYDDGILYANNQVSLIANEGVKKREIKKLAKQYGAEIVGYIEFTGDYQLEFSEEKSYDELNSIVSSLESDSNVESASLLRVSKLTLYSETLVQENGTTVALYPDDKKWDKWDMKNPKGNNWALEAIKAPKAWALKDEMDYTKIGILDNSVDENHEDLKFEKVWNSKTSSSDNEHATNIAGIIGAKFNNGKGISGMCPKAILYAYDSKRDKYTSDIGIKCGLSKLILNDVKVINCSFGYTELIIASSLLNRNIITNQNAIKTIENNLNYFKITYTDFFNKFIEEGYDFLIVHAAGNGNFYYYRIAENLDEHNYGIEISTKEKPGFTKCENITAENDIFSNITDKAIKDRIIVVGASGQDGKGENYKLSYLSNVGDRVDVLAPGENIYSTFPNNKYDSEKIGGTSCAAPYVTGLAGMIWGINKDLPASMVKNIIISSANIDVNNTDKNMINANIAVKLAKIRKEKIDNYNSEKGMVFLKIKDTSSDNIDDASVIIKDENGNVVDTVNSNETGEVYAFLGSGTYNLLFEKEGYESFLLEDVEIKKDDVLYKNILMRKASNVSGKVVDNVGNSLKNVNLTFKTSNSDNIAVKTDESGSFSKKLVYGTYTLIISKDGYEDKEMTVEIDSENKDLGTIDLKKDTISNSYLDNSYLGEWYCGKGLYVSETNFNYISRVLNIKSISANSISFSLKVSLAYSLPEPNSSDRFEYSGFAENIIVTSVKNGKVEFTFEDYSHTPSIDGDVSHGTLIFKNDTIYYTSDSSGYLSGDNLEFTREMKKGFYRDKR